MSAESRAEAAPATGPTLRRSRRLGFQDSLFGRLSALVVVVLLIPHLLWYVLMRMERAEWLNQFSFDETAYILRAGLLDPSSVPTPEERARAAQAAGGAPGREEAAGGREPNEVSAAGGLRHGRDRSIELRRLPADAVPPSARGAMPPGLQAFMARLRQRLPAGVELQIHGPPPRPWVWVRSGPDAPWLVARVRLPPPEPRPSRMIVWLALSFSVAVLLALLAAWRLQRPLQGVVQAAARLGGGHAVEPVDESGPRELRTLTRAFNQMVSDLAQNERDRTVMLAGVAHDLRTPLARMRLRAEMVDESAIRDGLVRDIESLSHIVNGFLAFANRGPDLSAPVSVDAHCRRFASNEQSSRGSEPSGIELDLRAGPDFVLPSVTVDRFLSNLVDNARTYGAPPIVFQTAREAEGWRLSVYDAGAGIADDLLETARRPFVRLDPARGGNAHSGLGLAIVARLAQQVGGECRLGNRAQGGLQVDLRVPFGKFVNG